MSNAIVIILGILGVVFCFCGYTFRRYLPAVIGLGFGFGLGIYIKAFAAVSKAVHIGSLEDLLNLMNLAISEIDDKIIKVVQEMPDEALELIWNYMDKTWLILPIVLAILFCILGAKFYRTTAAVSAAFTVFFIADVTLLKGINTDSATIAAVAGLVTFFAVLLLYNVMFIAVTSFYGSLMILTTLTEYISISQNLSRIVAIALFLTGCIVQAVSLRARSR